MKCIELTQGRIAVVDDEDFEMLAQYRWCVNGDGYVSRNSGKVNGRQVTVVMHRIILSCPPGYEVDHKNGDKLDNRRCNLRIATRRQNRQNRPAQSNNSLGVKGVYPNRSGKGKPYTAQIRLNRKLHHLGCFTTIDEAKEAYNKAATIHHGEFARLN